MISHTAQASAGAKLELLENSLDISNIGFEHVEEFWFLIWQPEYGFACLHKPTTKAACEMGRVVPKRISRECVFFPLWPNMDFNYRAAYESETH